LVLVALASCRGGCSRADDRAATVEGRLALFPVATQIVAAIDVAKLRASPSAAKLASLAADSPSDQQLIDEFAKRTGLDPMRQISSITVAFPEEARRGGEMGLILRADHLDETRLVAYVRDQLQKQGDDLVATRHGRFTLWSPRHDPGVVGFFIDDRSFALGSGGWGERIADLAETARPSDSAATNLDLVHLVETVANAHAIWGAAIVPAETRRKLAADPSSASAANVKTLSAGIDVGKGLDATLIADMTNAADAGALATRVAESLRDAKRNAQLLMLGLGPYLDGVSARASGDRFQMHATVDERGFDDLLSRLRALLALTGAGGAIPGAGGQP
jgi:hypothetical protein